MKTYKLAFDVSTNNTGYALLDPKNKVIISGEIATKSQHANFAQRMAEDLISIEKELLGKEKLIMEIAKINEKFLEDYQKAGKKAKFDTLKGEVLEIAKNNLFEKLGVRLITVIETSKIVIEKNGHLTKKGQDVKMKLDLYQGMYMGWVAPYLYTMAPYLVKEFKLSSPTEWHIPVFGTELPRKEGKEQSIIIAEKLKEAPVKGDDEADAINIASIAEKLRDFSQVYNDKQTRAKDLKNYRSQLPRAEALVKKYELLEKEKAKVGKKLTKAELTVLNNNLDKVSDLKQKINNLNKNILKEEN